MKELSLILDAWWSDNYKSIEPRGILWILINYLMRSIPRLMLKAISFIGVIPPNLTLPHVQFLVAKIPLIQWDFATPIICAKKMGKIWTRQLGMLGVQKGIDFVLNATCRQGLRAGGGYAKVTTLSAVGRLSGMCAFLKWEVNAASVAAFILDMFMTFTTEILMKKKMLLEIILLLGQLNALQKKSLNANYYAQTVIG